MYLKTSNTKQQQNFAKKTKLKIRINNKQQSIN